MTLETIVRNVWIQLKYRSIDIIRLKLREGKSTWRIIQDTTSHFLALLVASFNCVMYLSSYSLDMNPYESWPYSSPTNLFIAFLCVVWGMVVLLFWSESLRACSKNNMHCTNRWRVPHSAAVFILRRVENDALRSTRFRSQVPTSLNATAAKVCLIFQL